mgnify:CR=1 FL=1
MNNRLWSTVASILVVAAFNTATAGDVEILAADFQLGSKDTWSVSVTLQHGDTGWDHYADNWRVVDAEGRVFGDRVLYHPHVDEQPFTRGLGGIVIPEGTERVFIEAHDTVHGWSPDRLEVDMRSVDGGRIRVEP